MSQYIVVGLALCVFACMYILVLYYRLGVCRIGVLVRMQGQQKLKMFLAYHCG